MKLWFLWPVQLMLLDIWLTLPIPLCVCVSYWYVLVSLMSKSSFSQVEKDWFFFRSYLLQQCVQEGILRKMFLKQNTELLSKWFFNHLLLQTVFQGSWIQKCHVLPRGQFAHQWKFRFEEKPFLWQLMAGSGRWGGTAEGSLGPSKMTFVMRMWCRR